MNITSLTSTLISVLKGNDKLYIFQEYDDSSLYNKHDIFSTVGIAEIKSADSFSDDGGVNVYQVLKIDYKVTVLGKNSDGEELISTAEGMYTKLFSSSLNVVNVSGGGVSYNAKLDRLQYEFSVSLNARLFGSEITCVSKSRIIALNENLTLSLDSFEFERSKSLAEIPSVCDGVIISDGGEKPLILKLCGNISSENSNALVTLETLISAEIPLDLSFLGLDIPPLLPKKYLLKGEKNSASNYCELLFWGADTSEVIAVE